MKNIIIGVFALISTLFYYSILTGKEVLHGYEESLSFMKEILNYKKKGGYEKIKEVEKCLFSFESKNKIDGKNWKSNNKSESLVYFGDLDPETIKIQRKEYGITIIIHLKNNMSYIEYTNKDYVSGEKSYRENDFIVISPLFFSEKEEPFVLAHISNLIAECRNNLEYRD